MHGRFARRTPGDCAVLGYPADPDTAAIVAEFSWLCFLCARCGGLGWSAHAPQVLEVPVSSPPASLLPAGAGRWEVVNEVAIRLGRDVRTVESWCEKGLLCCEALAGGYGGVWVAVTAEGWPINGPKVQSYRQHRSELCRQREAARRAAREAAAPPKKSRSRRRSA